MKHFAYGCTGGPDIVNLQLGFWCDSLNTFEYIKKKWKECAFEEEDSSSGSDEYSQDNFIEDAARGIVHAGTSLSILAGQNVDPVWRNGVERTPELRQALPKLIGSLDNDALKFIRIYDDIRHFGFAKHETITDLTEVDYCQLMNTAQSLWKHVLLVQKMSERGFFDNEFNFAGLDKVLG